LRITGTDLGGVKVDPAGDIARLHDIARDRGVLYLAPYLTGAGGGAFCIRQQYRP
jgi:hypothetical protein